MLSWRCCPAVLTLFFFSHSPVPVPARSIADVVLQAAERAPSGSPQSRRTERSVSRGVTHITDFQATGPLTFNVLRVNLADPAITVEVEPGRDRLYAGETVPEAARRESRPGHSVLGAVNADFWSMSPQPYTPIGMLVANGMICRAPGKRSVFGVTRDEKVFFDPVTLTATVRAGKRSLQVERFNDLKATESPVLFTPPVGQEVSAGAMPRLVLELEGNEFLPNQPTAARVVRRAEQSEAIPMGERTVVLAAPEKDLKNLALKPGDRVTLDARVPEVDGVITFCCGASPRIVRDGKISVEDRTEGLAASFATTRHPRTAVGVSADGRTLFLVTVDGRQPTVSIGQALKDLAAYMISLGCSDAVNLDGGGSTTMVVRGDVVNSPSDAGGPRRVVNSILVVSSRPTGPLAQLVIEPGTDPLVVPAGSSVELAVNGYDADYNPVTVDSGTLEWSADRVGQIQPAERPGAWVLHTLRQGASGLVRVQSGSVSAERQVEVVPAETVTVSPDVLLLSSGETIALRIEATGDGQSIPLQPSMIRLSASDRALSASAGLVTGMAVGQGTLRVSVGEASTEVPYYVDRFDARTLESFDSLAEEAKAVGSNFDANRTSLSVRTNDCREGEGCLAVNYTMNKGGGRSEISIPVGAGIEEEPVKLGLWIRGDGREAWVRGELVDAAGTRFLVDFTNGSKGVLWKDEWRYVTVPVSSLVGRRVRPGTRPRFPATFRTLTISQEQEALKATGELIFDGLQALYPPDSAKAE